MPTPSPEFSTAPALRQHLIRWTLDKIAEYLKSLTWED